MTTRALSHESLKKWTPLQNVDDDLVKKIKYFQGFKVYENDDDSRRNTSAMFLTIDDEMFAVGHNNEDNLLALTENDFAKNVSLESPRKINELSGKNIKKFTVTERFGVALTFDGKIIYWGMEMKSLQFDKRGKLYVKLPYEHSVPFKVVDFACGAHSITFLTDEGKVVIWGCINLFYSEFYDFKKLFLRKGIIVKSISCGWYHVVLLDQKGQVWTFGYGSVGQLGYNWDPVEFGYTNAMKVSLPKTVPCVKVECGAYSTVFLLENGEVYACGSNTQSDYLCVDEIGTVRTPAKVLFDEPISSIAAAYAWSSERWQSVFAAHSKNSNTYFKWGDDPKLEKPATVKDIDGLSDLFTNFKTPQSLGEVVQSKPAVVFDKIGDPLMNPSAPLADSSILRKWDVFQKVRQDILDKIHLFTVFGYFDSDYKQNFFGAFFVTTDDEVYGVGFNGLPKLLGLSGIDSDSHILPSPKRIDNLSNRSIKKILVSYEKGVAISKGGKAYFWNETSPPQIDGIMKGVAISDIANGLRFFVYLSKSSQVIFSGTISSKYQPENAKQIMIPISDRVSNVACGNWHCAILLRNGEVYTFGDGTYEQLGYDWKATDSPYEPKKVELPHPCHKIVCGVTSTFFLLRNGELYACGYNTFADVLGVGHGKSVKTPEKVLIEEPIGDICASTRNTEEGNFVRTFAAKTVSGKIYKWGGDTEKPTHVADKRTLLEVFENMEIPQTLSLVHLAAKETTNDSNAMSPVPEDNLYADPRFSDITIKLTSGAIPAHQVILSTGSAFFRRMLKTKENDVLDLASYNPNAVKALLKHVYQSDLGLKALEMKDILDFMELAEQDGDPELSRISQELLTKNAMYDLLQWYSKENPSVPVGNLLKVSSSLKPFP